MKPADLRREYLRRLGDCYLLCQACRFAEDHTPDGACRHPLQSRIYGLSDGRNGNGMEPGDDCWGFRPAPDCRLDVVDERIAGWKATEMEDQ